MSAPASLIFEKWTGNSFMTCLGLRSTTNQQFWISTDHYDRVCSWEVDESQMIITYVCNIVYMIITLSHLIANKSNPKILRLDDACSRVPDVVWRPCIIKARSYCLCHEKIGLPMTLNQPSFWIHKKNIRVPASSVQTKVLKIITSLFEEILS